MDGFESMFDLDGSGDLDIGEKALEFEFLDRAAAGDGDINWDKEPYEDDSYDEDEDDFDDGDDW